MKKKTKRIIAISLSLIIGLPLLTIGGYVSYVFLSYKRIGNISLEVTSNSNKETVKKNEELSLTTFNIGFGAYSSNYTFFMDTGYDKDGNVTKGTYSRGISKEDVLNNIDGSIEAMKSLDSDFYFVQEVDVDSTRAYHINQQQMIESSFEGYDSTFAIDYDSAYLFYPITSPHGKSKAGMSTLSSYAIKDSQRKEYTISTSFSKFFDLDRCFSVNRIEVEDGKQLVLINSHMSAYDEGGTIRNTQIHELYSFMKEEADKGNYVLTAGDFNHDMITGNPDYPQYDRTNYAYKDQIDQLKPDWLSYIFEEDGTSPFDDGFKVYAADNLPSCRDCDVVYTPGSTFVSTLDGFIASMNIEVKKVYTTKLGENGFAYSDHQPSTLEFILK